MTKFKVKIIFDRETCPTSLGYFDRFKTPADFQIHVVNFFYDCESYSSAMLEFDLHWTEIKLIPIFVSIEIAE